MLSWQSQRMTPGHSLSSIMCKLLLLISVRTVFAYERCRQLTFSSHFPPATLTYWQPWTFPFLILTFNSYVILKAYVIDQSLPTGSQCWNCSSVNAFINLLHHFNPQTSLSIPWWFLSFLPPPPNTSAEYIILYLSMFLHLDLMQSYLTLDLCSGVCFCMCISSTAFQMCLNC